VMCWEHLWVLVDVTRCYRNSLNEWMSSLFIDSFRWDCLWPLSIGISAMPYKVPPCLDRASPRFTWLKSQSWSYGNQNRRTVLWDRHCMSTMPRNGCGVSLVGSTFLRALFKEAEDNDMYWTAGACSVVYDCHLSQRGRYFVSIIIKFRKISS